jgi:hypothetical protein
LAGDQGSQPIPIKPLIIFLHWEGTDKCAGNNRYMFSGLRERHECLHIPQRDLGSYVTSCISSSVKSTQNFASTLALLQVVMYTPFSSRKTKWAMEAPNPIFFFIQRMIDFISVFGIL